MTYGAIRLKFGLTPPRTGMQQSGWVPAGIFELSKTNKKRSMSCMRRPARLVQTRGGARGRFMKVDVCIIGGGPSGLLLSQLLHLQGIDTVVVEKYSREHVLARIRAGVLEQGFAQLMREAQCGERMEREGEVHHGFRIAHDGIVDRVDLV